MRKFGLIVLSLLTLVTAIACAAPVAEQPAEAPAGEQETSGEKLVVAMELAYPPFETKDEAGEPIGVSVDIAMAFGEYLGREVEISNTEWTGLIPSLQTGLADMVISSMTITEERGEQVAFSNPYSKSMLAILANKESGIASIDDLNKEGNVVAVKEGSTGFLYAQANLDKCEIRALDDESACVYEVTQGLADGFLYDQLTIYRQNQENIDTTDAVFIPFQDTEYWGAAFELENTELLTAFNEFLVEFSADGGFDDITQKYLSEEKSAFDELNFEWFFDMSE